MRERLYAFLRGVGSVLVLMPPPRSPRRSIFAEEMLEPAEDQIRRYWQGVGDYLEAAVLQEGARGQAERDRNSA